MRVEGLPNVLPFHRAVVEDNAFALDFTQSADAPETPFRVHTRWIETEFDNTIPAYDDSTPRQSLVVEVGGKRLEVSLPGVFGAGTRPRRADGAAPGGTTAAKAPRVATPSPRRRRAPSSRSPSRTAPR